jgi:hypothetical protein
MIDYKGNQYAMIDGQEVSFGADFVFVNRDYSDALVQKALDRFYRIYAGNFLGNETEPKATVEDYRKGNLLYFNVPRMSGALGDFVRREFNSLIYKMSDRLKVEPSKTAGKVMYLGSDGYGQAAGLVEGARA